MIRIKSSSISTVIFIWSVFGFALLAAIFEIIASETNDVAVLFRALVAGLSLLVIMFSLKRPGKRFWSLFSILFIAFWVAYLLRLTVDTALNPKSLGREVYFYWSFALGACFLPALALLASGHLIKDRQLFWLSGVLGSSALVLGLMVGDTMAMSSAGTEYDSGRLGLSSLNPIFFGHLGASISLMGYWLLRRFKLSLRSHVLGLVLFALGALVVFLSGSRGPLVGLLSSLLFLELVKGGRLLFVFAFSVLPLTLLLAFDLSLLDQIFGSNLISRMQDAMTAADAASAGRINQLSSALDLFLAAPWTGAAIEDPFYKIYPHNVIIEAFMATGFFGGGVFIALISIGIVAAYRLAKRSQFTGFFGILFVQYSVAAQFSGAIYTSTAFWVLLAFVVSQRKVDGLGAVQKQIQLHFLPSTISSNQEDGANRPNHLFYKVEL